MRGWLQGFYDGEGWVTLCRTVRKSGREKGRQVVTFRVGVGNTDATLMDICARYLAALGIVPNKALTILRGSNKPFYRLDISSRSSVLAFAKEVGFASPAKIERLARVVEWIERPWAPKYYAYNPPAEELRRLYWDEGLGMKRIAALHGLDKINGHGLVRHRLRHYGIPTRPRSERRRQSPTSY